MGSAAPSLQYDPGVQSMHAVWPRARWNLPVSHRTHVSIDALGAIEPGMHWVGCFEPTEQDVPGVHVTHWLTLVITASEASLCVPPGHGSGAAEPSVQ